MATDPKGNSNFTNRNNERAEPTHEKPILKILENDGKTIADEAESLAQKLTDLKRAQIRNFYGPIVKLKESNKSLEEKLNDLHLMRPRLAYMNRRNNGAAEPLYACFDALIKNAKPDKKHLQGIFNFAEAVVAYHRG